MVYGEVDHDPGIRDPLLIRICHLIELQLHRLMITVPVMPKIDVLLSCDV